MRGRTTGSLVGLVCLLLDVALGWVALPQINVGREYTQALGWLDLRLDGLSLYFALLGLSMLGLALLAGRWAGLWQMLPLAATYLLVRSYSLGEWPLWLRLTAEAGAAALLLVGLALVVRRHTKDKPNSLARFSPKPPLGAFCLPNLLARFSPKPPLGAFCLPNLGMSSAILLTTWGMVALAVCSAEPSAVAGGLILAAGAAGLGLAISGDARHAPTPSPSRWEGSSTPTPSPSRRGGSSTPTPSPSRWEGNSITQLSTFNFQLSTFNPLQLVGLWLYLHAVLGRGELLYAALMLAGSAGTAVGLLRLRPRAGWFGWLLAGLSVAGFAGGAALVDGLLRPALAGLAGLPAWGALKVQRLDLPAPQPNAAVGVGLKIANDTRLLPLLALALAFGFALALVWLLYRLLSALARVMRHE